MRLFLLAVALSSQIALADGGVAEDRAAPIPCPAVGAPEADGIPACPVEVSHESAWRVWRCGYELVRQWHPPTADEKKASQSLITAWAAERADGLKPATGAKIVAAVTAMGGQVCRAHPSADDSYLVVWAAKADYSGANLLLRESAQVSKIMMVFPHSDSDGYFQAGPIGFANTHALVYVGNGHHRGAIKGTTGRETDWAHTKNNLGYDTIVDILHGYPSRAMFHVHGDQASTSGLDRPRDGSASTAAWEKAVEDATRVTKFGPLNADFTTDGLTHPYVKSELPAVIYMKQPDSVARIFANLEKDGQFWDSGKAFADEPVFQDGEVAVDIGAEEGDLDNVPDDDFEAALVTSATPAPKPWPGPPHRSEVGTHPINVVVPQWTDLKPAQKQLAQQASEGIAAFYRKMSRGRLTMQGHGILMDVPLAHSPDSKTLGIACGMARKLGGWKTVLMNTWKHGGQHASGCAYDTQYLGWVLYHEIGHLLGLSHAGKFELNPDGTVKAYNQYGDNGNSVMADAVGSSVITMDEVYYLGWLDKTEYTLVTDKTQSGAYALHSIDELAAGKKDIPFAVILHPDLVAKLPGAQGRPLMISYPHNCVKDGKPCVSLTYMSAASALYRNVAVGGDFKDSASGLRVVVAGPKGGAVQVSVAFD